MDVLKLTKKLPSEPLGLATIPKGPTYTKLSMLMLTV